MTETPDEEPATKDVTFTCHTEGCGNAGHAIPMTVTADPEPLALCGVCGQQITDIQPVEEVTE